MINIANRKYFLDSVFVGYYISSVILLHANNIFGLWDRLPPASMTSLYVITEDILMKEKK